MTYMIKGLLIAAALTGVTVVTACTPTPSSAANPVNIINCWPNRQSGVTTPLDTKCQADQQERVENVEKPKPNPCDPKRFSKAWKPISKALKNWANLKPKQKAKVIHKIVVLAKLKKECRNCYPTNTIAAATVSTPDAKSAGKNHNNGSRKGGDGNRASLIDLSIMPAAYTYSINQ